MDEFQGFDPQDPMTGQQRACAHTVPYLTGVDCERCGATPEQMGPKPEQFRADLAEAKARG